MNKNRKPIFKWILISLVSLGLLCVLGFFIFKNQLVNLVIRAKIEHFNQSRKADVKVKSIYLDGLTRLHLNYISLKAIQSDTLLSIDSAIIEISFWKALTGKVDIKNLELINTTLTPIFADSSNNFSFLIRKQKKESDQKKEKSYAKQFDAIADAIFEKLPSSVRISNFIIKYTHKDHVVKLSLADLSIIDHSFNSNVIIEEDSTRYNIGFQGQFNKYERNGSLLVYPADKQKICMPYLKYRMEMDLGFDTLQMSLDQLVYENNILQIQGKAGIKNLFLNQWRIAADTVEINQANFDFKINIADDYFELDSASLVTFNKVSANPYFKYRPNPTKQVTFIVNKAPFPAQDLFESLPKGLFGNFTSIKTSGQLSYHAKLDVDLGMPDSLIFESELKSHKFKIEQYGKTDFRSINSDFHYTAYDKGVAIRDFEVGLINPNFRYLTEIPEVLRNAVMTSEDGGFYYHNGFYPEAFTRALITNIKEKRFARGGSTITMQLVKNVFLSRNKTMARKMEEALIVWIIENQHLISKDRMLEVYLNIIEWGPKIYGANEASNFYFNKDVKRLTLSEAIYLASIVPRPKGFMYSFDKSGNLKPYLKGYYDLVLRRMIDRQKLFPADTVGIRPDIKLSGPAKDLLIKPDTVEVESEIEIE